MRGVLLSVRAAAFRITCSVWRVDIHNCVARTSANNRELCRSGDKTAGGGLPVSRETRNVPGEQSSPPLPPVEKATAFHRRPTFALFHLPPAGSRAVALIEKLAELIKTPHPGRPAHIITLIQSLSVLRSSLLSPLSFSPLSPFFLSSRFAVGDAGCGIATLESTRLVPVVRPRRRFLLFTAERTDDLLRPRRLMACRASVSAVPTVLRP